MDARKFTIMGAACLIIMALLPFGFSELSAQSQIHPTGLLPEPTPPSWIIPSPSFPSTDGADQSCDNSAHLPPIGNQGSQGSCAGWAAGYYMKTYQEWEEHGWSVAQTSHQFSPAFMYNQINGGIDGGAYLSDALKMLCDMGSATLADMPYNAYNFTAWPDENDYRNGINYRSETAYAITLNSAGLATLKNYLLAGHVAVMGLNVYSNFDNIGDFNNVYCLSEVYGLNRGGHAATLCGFDDEMATADGVGAFKLANSWGSGWGASGYFWMSYEAVLSSITSHGYAYYTSDKTGYSPTFLARFHVMHWDRHALKYRFGTGAYASPTWSKDFCNWTMTAAAAITYPTSNIVVDLTDGHSFLTPGGQTPVFMRCQDGRPYNTYSGSITYFRAEELTWPAAVNSSSPPVAIPDNGSYAYATLMLAAPAPNIEVSTASLDFDTVFVGSQADLPLMIYNTGNDTLVISSVSPTNAAFSTNFNPGSNQVLPGDTLLLTVTFAPTTVTAYNASLNIANNDEPVSVALQGVGTAVPQPQIVVSPTQMNFGSVTVGSLANLPLTIANIGNATLVISSVSSTNAAFSTNFNPGSNQILPGDTLLLTVTFAPTAVISYDASLNIANNDEPVSVALQGVGTAVPTPQIVVTPTQMNFGSVTVGSQASLPLTIANIGNATLIISSVSPTNAVFTTNFNPGSNQLLPGDSLLLTVTFAPTAVISYNASLNIANNDEPVSVALQGVGTAVPQPQIVVTPTQMNFGSVTVGSQASLPLTIANIGNAALIISSVSPTNAAFTTNFNPGSNQILPGDTLLLMVTFAPTAVISYNASLNIANNDEPVSVALQGVGTAVPQPQIVVTPTQMNFGSVTVGSQASLPLTIANIGNATLVINSVSPTNAAFTTNFNPGSNQVLPGDTLLLTVTFAPTAVISYNASLNIANNDEPVSVALQGVGTAVPQPQIVVSPAQMNFGSVTVGSQASLPLTIANAGTATLAVSSIASSDSCFETDFNLTDSLILPGDSLIISVHFSPASAALYEGTLEIENNDQPVQVPLSGTGMLPPEPEISLSSPELNFGTILIGQSAQMPLTIYNLGTANLLLYQIAMGDPSFDCGFDAADSLIAPGDSLTLAVFFTPIDSGDVLSTLTIINNDHAVDVGLIGRGEFPLGQDPERPELPLVFALNNPYPNPFNPQTTIAFALPQAAYVKLTISDLTGRLVAELLNRNMDPGVHQVIWQAEGLASGAYFCRIEAGTSQAENHVQYISVVKMTLLK